MKFESKYSSSASNLYIVTDDTRERLIIDPGVSWKNVQGALDYDLQNIAGCLAGHEHRDHSKSINEVMKAGIDVYASEGTFHALNIKHLEHRRANAVMCREIRTVGGFEVYAFEAQHDAADPFSFIVRSKTTKKCILFATDTFCVPLKFDISFEIIAIECSYDRDILAHQVDNELVNEAMARRLLYSHMEKAVTFRYLKDFCNLSKCTEIHLLHMSRGSIDQEETRQEFEDKLFIKTLRWKPSAFANY